MLNFDQWKEDANARPALAAMLQDPILANALEIVSTQGLAPILCPTGVDIVQFGAMSGFKRDGYFECLNNLRALAKITPRKKMTEKPWTVDPKSIPEEVFIDSKIPLDNPLPTPPGDPPTQKPSDPPPIPTS